MCMSLCVCVRVSVDITLNSEVYREIQKKLSKVSKIVFFSVTNKKGLFYNHNNRENERRAHQYSAQNNRSAAVCTHTHYTTSQ